MNTKHHTSLKIAKQLAEAGIVIESEYYWDAVAGGSIEIVKAPSASSNITNKERCHDELSNISIPAPIATEILENMPDGCEYGVNLVKLMSGYGVELTSYKTMPYDRLEFIQDKNPCDALALLLIRLTKDGLV